MRSGLSEAEAISMFENITLTVGVLPQRLVVGVTSPAVSVTAQDEALTPSVVRSLTTVVEIKAEAH